MPKTSMDKGIEILLFMSKKMKKKLWQTSQPFIALKNLSHYKLN
jgi:hypothetical protein